MSCDYFGKGGYLFIIIIMKRFFKHFPEATVVVAPWDTGERGFNPIKRHWSDFTVQELKRHNLKHRRAIYFTPCDMMAPEHKMSNHRKIRAWYCDIDVAERGENISKKEVEERKAAALGRAFFSESLPTPTFIVETRNGFHVYWLALDGVNPDNFDWIEKNIVEELEGDPKACKLVQLMRLPGFYNWKDGAGFPCRVLPDFTYEEEGELKKYHDDEWLKLFGPAPIKKDKEYYQRKKKVEAYLMRFGKLKENGMADNDIFKIAAEMPQEKALAKFSGTEAVAGERYEFREVMGGRHLNIYINGKQCASFVDLNQNKLFCPKGSGKGSPNIIEWLKWYNPNLSGHELALILKKHLL